MPEMAGADASQAPEMTSRERRLAERRRQQVPFDRARWRAFKDALHRDVEQLRKMRYRVAPFLFPHLTAVLLYRIAVELRRSGLAVPARAVTMLNQALTGAELDPAAQIGPGLTFAHTDGVVVGMGVVAGADLSLYGGTLLGSNFGESRTNPRWGHPVIGDGVTVYSKASVIGPVRIGDGACIGAHALVLTDVPAGCVAKGVPATAGEAGAQPAAA